MDENKTARLREEILAKRRERKAIREKDIIKRLKAQGIEYKDLKTTQIVSDFLEVRVSESETRFSGDILQLLRYTDMFYQ